MQTPWLQMALALVAVVCGAIVGVERERREKPAGLRTMVLVSLGSAVFTMASFVFTTTTGDSGRVAAQIVTGIGFLGAGAILHGGGTVTGMTTAATIWVTAATGMVVGCGYAGAGLGLSLLTRFVLAGIYIWEARFLDELHESVVELVFDVDNGKTAIRIVKILEDHYVRAPSVDLTATPEGVGRWRLVLKLTRRNRREMLAELAALPAMREIHERLDAKPASSPPGKSGLGKDENLPS
jgi:putative Mg2+ transporter-C (MgtC) family protein